MLMRLMNVQPNRPGSFQGVPRGEHRRPRIGQWVGLWPRVRWPEVERGLLVWQDGRVEIVEEWGDFDTYQSADLRIMGGHVFETDDTSWQYAVLTAAGYTFEPVGGAPSLADVFTATFQPTF